MPPMPFSSVSTQPSTCASKSCSGYTRRFSFSKKMPFKFMSSMRSTVSGESFLARRTGLLASLIFVSRSSAGKFKTRDHFRIFDIGGVGENRIHGNANGQFPALAVVDHAAHRTDFKYALLLMLGFCEVFAIAEELEVTQAGQHRPHPDR